MFFQRLAPRYPAVCLLLSAYGLLFLAMAIAQGDLTRKRTVAGFFGIRSPVLIRYGAVEARAIRENGEYWRLLTATFLHGSLLHLALNGLALRQVGQLIEEWYGGGVLIALHVVAGVAANVISVFSRPIAPFVQVGSSGALFGLLAFAAVFALHGRRGWHRRLFWIACVCLIAGLLLGRWIRADNAAHLGGAIVGGFLGLFEFAFRPGVLPPTLARTAAACGCLLIAAAFGLQFQKPPAGPQNPQSARFDVRRWVDRSRRARVPKSAFAPRENSRVQSIRPKARSTGR